MQHKGLLVANDASPSRSRGLVKNIELAGVTNAVVLNEQPNRLAACFPEFFDRVLVDAPCSGEGMFRRDKNAMGVWSANKPETCARMQKEILRHAASMVKPGGKLLYSTCTFNTKENEEQIKNFLETHEDFNIIAIDYKRLGMSPGFLQGTARIWPHISDGEGFFVALLEKGGHGVQRESFLSWEKPLPRAAKRVFDMFCEENLLCKLQGHLLLHERRLFRVPDGLPSLRGLRTARSGWYLGDISKDRFTPSQAFAMGLCVWDVRYCINLTYNEAVSFLKGNTLTETDFESDTEKPWVLVCYKDYALGWARWVNGRLKNNLPKGWVMN
jgi:NOL1/NOP2/fmu family ribosome biogenesis protein